MGKLTLASALFALIVAILVMASPRIYAASGDRTSVNRLAHGAPVSGSACVQGTQRNTAKFVFTCMTSGVWKKYSSASH